MCPLSAARTSSGPRCAQQRKCGGLHASKTSQRSTVQGSAVRPCATYPIPETDKEPSPIDTPQEWITPKPSKRPDIFPDLDDLETPLPKPLPGDPEQPEDEEWEEEQKKKSDNDPDKEPPEPGEEPEKEEDEEEEEEEEGDGLEKKKDKEKEGPIPDE